MQEGSERESAVVEGEWRKYHSLHDLKQVGLGVRSAVYDMLFR